MAALGFTLALPLGLALAHARQDPEGHAGGPVELHSSY